MKKLDCPHKCDVPEGIELRPVPPARHAWSDVIVCPYTDECGLTYLVFRAEEGT